MDFFCPRKEEICITIVFSHFWFNDRSNAIIILIKAVDLSRLKK